jgi:REP element-mobilizing transposase RayT
MPYCRLFYHFVWATKERLPLITDEYQEPIYRVIAKKVGELRGIVHALNGLPDHVHLVATVPPSVPLSTFIGQIKGSSSHLAQRLRGDVPKFAWQTEYGVISVSEAHLPVVVRYVRLQQQCHTTRSLNHSLENYQ